MMHTESTLQIIGEQVGYKDLAAFSQQYVQFYGFRPTKVQE